ncbi:hypothetical protein [Methanohalobium sp.]|uniref:hypothetical protein n=1 Tax=Methanohalobium sp. TaxID=2837493 RepID=UPI0025DE5CF8|nr:hypothetical protein [Methanohalobium sp.]
MRVWLLRQAQGILPTYPEDTGYSQPLRLGRHRLVLLPRMIGLRKIDAIALNRD